MDTESLSHTQWNCKYHIVFAPKYRRQAIYGKIREDISRPNDIERVYRPVYG